MSSKDEAKKEADTKAPPQEPGDAATLASLLEEIRTLLKRYIVFPHEDAVIALALWVPHTWAFAAFDFTPYIHIFSPILGCGKTTLFYCLRELCANSCYTIKPTEAVVFRIIDEQCPTFLMDETDCVFDGKDNPATEGIRAMLNAGYARGAIVYRCHGQNHELRRFKVFCPKSFAGIGNIPPTIASRSIKIVLGKRRKDQLIYKLRERELAENARPIVEKLRGWCLLTPGVIEQLRAEKRVMGQGGASGGKRSANGSLR